jgi:membrane protein YdbS with pleckstrin-like domain
MHSHRFYFMALAMLMLASVAAALMAGVAVMGMTLTPPVALGALALCAVLVTGVVVLHLQLREARWDAGYRLR